MSKTAIALGSNLGDSLTTLESSLTVINSIPGVNLVAVSSWYRTQPIGPPQPDYLNGCAILNVQQTPEELLALLQAVELQFGRVRNEKWGARTLDLDIILYEDLMINTPNLTIPHPRIHERAFVLVPLAQIAGDWQEPKTEKAIAQLAGEIDTSGVKIYA